MMVVVGLVGLKAMARGTIVRNPRNRFTRVTIVRNLRNRWTAKAKERGTIVRNLRNRWTGKAKEERVTIVRNPRNWAQEGRVSSIRPIVRRVSRRRPVYGVWRTTAVSVRIARTRGVPVPSRVRLRSATTNLVVVV